ncbi:Glycosyl transferase family 2 [Halorubrum aquaticum]|uniref:Glycosyl transferase family 2 n=1 Tax=Halorubrum aquaticum TaxID=387340 RepID=A0A1I3A5M5_9EURY|nr:glycosyltransferase [Halorubrum aquaticum]SFH45442.1 Glycosyl transferase family 2 [Halorubrum aquaticum]
MSDRQFSVLIATYEGDDLDDLSRALQSVIDQTVRPDEIVVVADGPLTAELEATLDDFESAHPDLFSRTALSTNQGLGAALNHGVETCSHEWIARMDSDDLAVEDRFEQQLDYLGDNPETDVLGGYIGEFDRDPDDLNQIREVPTTCEDIASMGRFRCPMNHPSVMFRRSAVIEAGNYRSLRSMQDYELWMRMLSQGYTLENVPTVLVKCHAGDDLYYRRGGISYAKLDYAVQKRLLQMGSITFHRFMLNLLIRLPIRLLPACIRGVLYKQVLRN